MFVCTFLKVFEGVYNNSRMLHFLTAVVVSFGIKSFVYLSVYLVAVENAIL